MGKLEEGLLLSILKEHIKSKEKETFDMSNVDWNVLFELSIEHKIFSIVYEYMQPYIPSEFIPIYFANNYHRKMHIHYKITELQQIINESNENGIDIILIKGLSLSKLIYNDTYSRTSSDIDILVSEENIPSMEKMMLKLGYTRRLDSQDDQISEQYKEMILKDRTPTIYNLSYDNHEVSYFKSINEMVGVQVEIKRATSSIPKEYMCDFLQSTQTIKIDNIEVKTLNNLYTLIHLFTNAYHNTEHSLFWGKGINLRDYFDIYNFLLKYYNYIDFNIFTELCKRYQIEGKVMCVLENLDDLFSDNIFKEIINDIKSKNSELNSINTVVEWESLFLDRLFSNEFDIMHDFNRLYKKRCYSSLNENYYNRYSLKRSSYKKLEDKKHGKYPLFYKFSYEFGELTLSIILSEKLSKEFDKFKVMWRVIDNEVNSEISNKDIMIYKEGDAIVSESNQRNFIKNISESLPKKEVEVTTNNNLLEMKLTYPLEELIIDADKSNNLLCYNGSVTLNWTDKIRGSKVKL